MDLYDLLDPVELTAAARLALAPEDRPINEFQLGQWFPENLIDDIDFRYDKGTTRTFTDAMPFRSWTTEAPIGNRPGRARVSGEMPPLSLKFILTEYDRIRQRVGRSEGGILAEAIEGDVFGDIDNGVRALENRMEIAMADAIVTGNLSIAENGLAIDVDFQRSVANASTVGTAWATAATCTPIDDEVAVMDLMIDNEGLGPADLLAMMNSTTARLLTLADQVRNAAGTVRVQERLNGAQVAQLRVDHELPPIRINDSRTNGVDGTNRKLIPDGMVIYLPANNAIGETQYGVPAMADEPEIALERDDRPGPIAYLGRTLDPLTVYTVIDAIGIPILKDPNATYALDVAP